MNVKEEPAPEADPNQEFYDKAIRALRGLFDNAKAAQELHFAMALMPEFRGSQDGGWNTAEDAINAYDQYTALLKAISKDDPARIRIVLAFYMHVAEGSGFYEVPKKMLLTVQGLGNNIIPFDTLVRRHEKTGRAIAPNANRIMKDLMGHAFELGFIDLWEVVRDAFDPDVRNAIAHADYTLVGQGMRLRMRNGGQPRTIPWKEFDALMSRGLNFFSFIRQISNEYVRSYDPPKTIQSQMDKREPITDYTIYFDPTTGLFGLTTGKSPPKGYGGGNASSVAKQLSTNEIAKA